MSRRGFVTRHGTGFVTRWGFVTGFVINRELCRRLRRADNCIAELADASRESMTQMSMLHAGAQTLNFAIRPHLLDNIPRVTIGPIRKISTCCFYHPFSRPVAC
jgi:hypothetical protein